MIIVSCGLGTNSTAMLVGMKERGIRPDYITFADTGGEKPHTYEHMEILQEWLKANDFPPIMVVKKGGLQETLEEECLRRKALPSVAYGWKTCSQKYKIQPQEKYFNNEPAAKAVWKSGKKISRWIGFDWDEPSRAIDCDSPKYQNHYPLIEWKWGRKECIEAIEREGLPLPGKSSCWFCPNSRPNEVKWLKEVHPDLMERAIAIERNAETRTIAGLGRQWSWESLIATDDMFSCDFQEIPCGCYDG